MIECVLCAKECQYASRTAKRLGIGEAWILGPATFEPPGLTHENWLWCPLHIRRRGCISRWKGSNISKDGRVTSADFRMPASQEIKNQEHAIVWLYIFNINKQAPVGD